jgi:predicted esterase
MPQERDGRPADERSEPVAPRPGPDVLYGENPTPPQLENGPGWTADPLLVSGAEAYVEGEYLYQDYVLDDHGADLRTMVDGPPDHGERLGGLFAIPSGDLYYPNDPERFAYNAADLLEFRARPTDEGVVYRITLNTMCEADAAAVAIGIDTTAGDPGPEHETDWEYGLGDLGAPADHVLVTWGEGAELDGEPLADDRVSVDVERNQLEVEVPLDPAGETWRHYCLTGLWNPEAGGFRQVAVDPDEETPGGRLESQSPPPVFNVGFRFEEPFGAPLHDALDLGRELLDVVRSGGPRVLGRGAWREHRQARALTRRDVSELHTDLDFSVLEAGETDRSGVPETGYLNLLYPSRFEFGEGRDPDENFLGGRIQPYALYVPSSYDPNAEADLPMVLLCHSLGCSYNQYGIFTPNYVTQLGEEYGAAVIVPQTRGPVGWFQREAELDVFEAWRDVESRYPVDRSRVTLSGYSMGGYGTLVLAAKYPDLFGRGFAVVGPPTEDPVEGPTNNLLRAPALVTRKLFGGGDRGELLGIFSEEPENALRITENLRHVPMLLWNGIVDPLVPLLAPTNYAERLRSHGYRHQLELFTGTHLLLVLRDNWTRGGRYLSKGRVPASPARVTYRRVPDHDHPDLDLRHDGAYWVRDIEVREGRESGLVDATCYATGYAEPERKRYTSTGTNPLPHTKRGLTWEDPEDDPRPPANAVGVRLSGVDRATLWVERPGVDPTEPLHLRAETDGDATLVLKGSFGEREVEVPDGETVTVDLEQGAESPE